MTIKDAVSQRENVFVRLLSTPLAIYSGVFVTIISLFPFVFDDDTNLRKSFDLSIYYGAIKNWLNTGDLYSWAIPPEEIYGFTYPPFAAIFFTPIALLDSARTLSLVFLFVNMAATVAVLVLSFRSLKLSSKFSWGLSLWLAPLLLFTFPIHTNMWMGQINMILLLLMLIDGLLLSGTKFSGICSAIAASIKMTPALFIIFFLARKDWAGAIRFVCTGIAGIALSFLVDAQISWEFFTRRIFEGSRVGSLVEPLSFNILGETSRLFFQPANSILYGILAIALLWVGFQSTRILSQNHQLLLATCTVGFLMLMVSPISWNHHWVWATPAVIACAIIGWRTEDTTYMFLAVSGTVLFCLRFESWFSGHGWDIGYWPIWAVGLHALPGIWTCVFVALPYVRARKSRTAELNPDQSES